MRKKRVRRRLVRVLFSVGAEWSPYHRFCRGIEFFLLSAWECKKGTGDGRTDRQTEKGLVLPLPPLPPWNVQGNEETDSGREAHLVPQLLLQNTQSFAISISRQESTLAALHNAECRMQAMRMRGGGEKEIYEAASAHFNNEAAFSIFHPSIHPPIRDGGRRAFSPLITRVFIILLIRRSVTSVRPSANLHLNQGLLWRWRRRRRKRREANNQPTN